MHRSLQTGLDLAADVPGASPEHPVPQEIREVDADGAGAPLAVTWVSLLRDALVGGRIGQAQYQAIRIGLGEPPVERYPDLDPGFLPAAWADAARILLGEAADTPVEELRLAARTARDRLDPIGTTLRFEERFAARSFRMWTDEHGQQHARIAFDDDAAAWVQAILSAALRPRRGPRFVTPGDPPVDTGTGTDDRFNEQLQYDTLLAVIRTGAAADPDQAFGDRQPGIRIHVPATATAPDTATTAAPVTASEDRPPLTGVGHLEDGGTALPPGVIETYLCDAGTLTITTRRDGSPLDVGRERRLFTRAQRIAIAARDGGCIAPHCTAPISWCEYHHIDPWSAGGRTDIADGVPLCRACHLRLHNHGHRIERHHDPATGTDTYTWHPPPDPDTGITPEPIALRTRSPRRFALAPP